ncbi:T6SS phospholipase effector Tle1-like catalytic domain-containing protein, partial [Frateuria defendens]|uniref:phospholipase effector Tle1 domain-containing protein n=1 Tax=Frateuria defendens TaxID=2219559 RepID=UPI000A9AE596
MADREDRLDPDGIRHDGVSFYPADAQRLQSYMRAGQELSQFQVPVLIHEGNPHERLFVACFDGTGNDENKDPEHKTNVAKINDQIRSNHNPNIEARYVAGPGTQNAWLARTVDGATGGTYDARIEQMYKLFIDKAKEWHRQDPQAEIRVVATGFSRGAEQAAGFARLVQERGIQDRAGAAYTKDADGFITHVDYTKPPLVTPGQVAQAEALFDPVGTGHPYAHDRRPPPSVISGFQVMAEDERRAKFKSDHIIDPGLSPDGRFLGVAVAGAHSDVGGSYHRDGLAVRSDNLMIDYLNALSDKPFLARSPEPDDPRLNVVHRSEEGMLLYRLDNKVDRQQPEGYNERLVPRASHLFGLVHRERPGVADPYNAEPRDEALSQQFERQTVQTGPNPPPPIADAPARAAAPGRSLDEAF